jgi:hypothetical protein
MDQSFTDVFARHGSAGTAKSQEEVSGALDAACRDLAGALAACAPALRQDLLAVIVPRVRALLEEKNALARQMPTSPERAGTGSSPSNGPGPGNWNLPGVTDGFPFAKLSPELLEWARQQFSEEEFLAGLREIEETGGLEFRDLLPELEERAGRDE